MGARRKRSRNSKRHVRAEAADVDPNPLVEQLRRSFAKFRRVQPLRTRIPDSLRNAALAALQGGTSESAVRRACGVTSDQLAQWRKHQQSRGQMREADVRAARVFPVVDEMAGVELTPSGQPGPQDLELRIGGWAISVRPVEG